MLPHALSSVLMQETGGVLYEVIIVDNNSNDRTREVVESYLRYGDNAKRLRYVFEGRQGLPCARNTGIKHARAPIIAFTDDDVFVAKDWVRKIKQAFDDYPEVDLIGGKVLPRFSEQPPAWLTRAHWSPLAIQDHGDEPFTTSEARPVCLVGANMSLRREVFERVGLFDIRYVRIGVSSSEDNELQQRLYRAGGLGMYVPGIVVTADVQPERLTKAYHRAWHAGNGKSCGMMNVDGLTSPDGRLMSELPDETVRLFGTPAYIYRDLLDAGRHWLLSALHNREDVKFTNENWVRHRISYIRETFSHTRTSRTLHPLVEIYSFGKNLLRKKLRSLVAK